MRKTLLTAGAMALSLVSASVYAAVSAEEAARLGDDLTPIGAERAGSEDGRIPAWDGGLSRPGEDVNRPQNPFADEEPLYTITHDNLDEYRDRLSPGQIAMFERYDTFYMPIYPTHRTSTYPQEIFDIIERNATNASLMESGNGLENFEVAVPFPIPSNGLEVIWNHLTRYRGGKVERHVAQIPVQSNGRYEVVRLREQLVWPENLQGGRDAQADDNVLFYFLQQVLAPGRLTGTVLLVHDTIDQVREGRRAWIYNAGQRRVRRAPNVAYDGPGTAADGLRTSDQLDMFNGAPDKYNWELVGKKEMYIPYNNYQLLDTDLAYSDIILPGHENPEYTRYELHRVWHVEGTLKEGERMIYSRRSFFVDEDTWTAAVIDQYDGRGDLWRVSLAYHVQFYGNDVPWMAMESVYDLNNGRYISLGLANEETNYMNFDIDARRSDFSTNALRRMGIR